MNKLSIFGLIAVTVFWGAGFPLLKFATEDFPTFYLLAFRFFLASLVLAIPFYKKLKLIDKNLLKSGFFLSIPLFLVFLCTVVGIRYTSSTNSSFYCCLAVLIVPFLAKAVFKTKIDPKSLLCGAICFLGLFMVSMAGVTPFNIGDVICFMASIFFAIQIIMTEHFVKNCDTDLLTILEMFFVSVYALVLAVFFEDFPVNVTQKGLYSLIFTAVFCTAFAFYMQTKCQKFLTGTQISVILTLEPVFGVLMSALILKEVLTLGAIVGGMFIVFALLISQVNISKFKLKNKSI